MSKRQRTAWRFYLAGVEIVSRWHFIVLCSDRKCHYYKNQYYTETFAHIEKIRS